MKYYFTHPHTVLNKQDYIEIKADNQLCKQVLHPKQGMPEQRFEHTTSDFRCSTNRACVYFSSYHVIFLPIPFPSFPQFSNGGQMQCVEVVVAAILSSSNRKICRRCVINGPGATMRLVWLRADGVLGARMTTLQCDRPVNFPTLTLGASKGSSLTADGQAKTTNQVDIAGVEGPCLSPRVDRARVKLGFAGQRDGAGRLSDTQKSQSGRS